MACRSTNCERCRPHGMVEWGAVRAWWMRDVDDEGIGGVKRPCPRGGWSPFNWWYETRRPRWRQPRRERVEMALRRFAHRRGWLWSPSQAWRGVPFGRHGARLLPVNKRHAATVLRGHQQHDAAMRDWLDC